MYLFISWYFSRLECWFLYVFCHRHAESSQGDMLPKLVPTVGKLTVPDGSETDCLLSGCFLATGHLQQPEATLRSHPRDLLLTSHQLSSCGILCRLRKSEFLFCNKLKTVLQGSCDTVRPTKLITSYCWQKLIINPHICWLLVVL